MGVRAPPGFNTLVAVGQDESTSVYLLLRMMQWIFLEGW